MQHECTHQALLEKKNIEIASLIQRIDALKDRIEALKDRVHSLKLQVFAAYYGATQVDLSVKVGKIVRLLTGGPEMTIVDIDEEMITALCFMDGKPFEMELPEECWALKVVV
jgi:hypothetical protein